MHLNPFLVYLWLELDAICGIFMAIASISILIFIVALIAYLWDSDMKANEYLEIEKKRIKRIGVIAFTAMILASLTPTTKQFATIIILPKIANSKTTERLLKSGDNVSKLLLEYTEKQLQTVLGKKNHEDKSKNSQH